MQHYSLLIKDVDTTQMLSAMSIMSSATREESSYHFSDLLDGINCVNAASYKMSHQVVQGTVPSKLSSDHGMLSVLPALQQVVHIFLISCMSVVMGFTKNLPEVWKNKDLFKRFADLVLKYLNLWNTFLGNLY